MINDAVLSRFHDLFGPEFGHGKALETERLRRALAALGDPQTKLPRVAHVAGTNGKGSTIAFLRAIAGEAGLKADAFTKPHLMALNERFVVGGEIVEDSPRLIEAAERVAAVSTELTQFEAQVAAAFLLFAETPADLCLIETGMGGRDDATNVVSPALSIITPIALDHQDALGATVAEIATHKAGILKRGVPAVIARQSDDASAVIEAEAARVGAPLMRCCVDWDCFASNGRLVVQGETRALDLPLPSLVGAHQIDNAGLAVTAMRTLFPDMSDGVIARGLMKARWPGRLQALTSGPLARRVIDAGGELWLDGAHNAHAAETLARALADLGRRAPRPLVLIIGMRARKDAAAFLAPLAPLAQLVLTVPLGGDGADPRELAELASGVAAPSLDEAIGRALELRAPRIVVTGSLKLAGEALARERSR